MNEFNNTIAAVSTPHGKGGVALIRISGEKTAAILCRCFLPHGKDLPTDFPRKQIYGDIVADGKTVDDGMAVFMKSPASYTGEDAAEITCHGGILITKRVLDAVFAAGASPAAAGEFTRRAFINGKLNLSAAEAVANILEAKSNEQILRAQAQKNGALTNRISAIGGDILSLVSKIYAKIDYPDEDLAEVTNDGFINACGDIARELEKLACTYSAGCAIFEGIPTVICGAPNTGKSSLYNLLCGRQAAIVTDIAGTTRDTLECDLPFGKVMLHLCDTAGLRDTDDVIEAIGARRAKEKIAEANLIFALFDMSRPLQNEDRELIELLKGENKTKIALLNKCDLKSECDIDYIKNNFENCFAVSAKSGDGISAVRDFVEKLYIDGNIECDGDAILTNSRQYANVSRALECVNASKRAAADGFSADVAAGDLEIALSALNEIDGKCVSDEIVNEIFSHFCVGK